MDAFLEKVLTPRRALGEPPEASLSLNGPFKLEADADFFEVDGGGQGYFGIQAGAVAGVDGGGVYIFQEGAGIL